MLGPNGAGKTTSLSMAVALLRPDAGMARIFGVDVWERPVEAKALVGVHAPWRKAIATGADLLWRVRTDKSAPNPPTSRTFLTAPGLRGLTPAAERRQEPMLVRVIDYTVDDGRQNPTSYRLFTTLLDPAEVSAVNLAAAYAERWEIELTFDELKTHQRGPRTVPAVEVARSGPPRDLGTPALPLRDPLPDGRSCDPLRTRPGPAQHRRRAADLQADRRRAGGFSP
ncbi:hypothetical protein GCM10009789_02100 [Kribbella sancticallisti]|uniref:Uncharacterized protein n=1 Tax=Kribbella sancticallisti TaxID=460087 RepID=A0ABP4MXD5_9ACTN